MLKHLDLATDRIFSFDKARTVKADVSRYIIDVNRRRNDFSEKGVIIRKSWDGERVWRKLPSEEEREILLEEYYDPFYKTLDSVLKGRKKVLLIDGHSMNPLGGRNSIDPDKVRPDFCLASNHGTTCSQEMLDRIKGLLEKKKHWVELDKPYSGRKAGIINRYGAPGKVDAIEFEVNKRLYMKDITNPKSVQAKKIKALNRMLGKIFQKCLKK